MVGDGFFVYIWYIENIFNDVLEDYMDEDSEDDSLEFEYFIVLFFFLLYYVEV